MTDALRRRLAEVRGRRAEIWAAWLLRLKGFRVLDRRWRGPGGEIDLVARRGSLILFVEVKARNHRADALAAIHPAAPAPITAAASAWLARKTHRTGADPRLRFDVITVRPAHLPRHLADAFRPPS